MRITVRPFVLAACLLPLAAALPAARAQQKPRRDVVDVPAIGAGLCVSNVFQSHMVLQRDRAITIWGWAAPQEQVTVVFGDERQSATAGADRSWQVTLAARPATSEPQRLTVRGARDELVLDDVLIGDVWVLGGQSNMEFELAKVENGPLEIVSARFPQLRVLTVPYGVGPEQKRSFARLDEWSDWFGRHFRKGDWDRCTPEVARELSAIGYTFARRLHMATGVPIGVIDASRGGTTAETWTPLARLQAMDSAPVRQKLDEWRRRVDEWDAAADLERRVTRHREWLKRQLEAGNEVPADRRAEPTDLQPGPVADPNHPGHGFAGMIAPLTGLSVKGVIFHR